MSSAKIIAFPDRKPRGLDDLEGWLAQVTTTTHLHQLPGAPIGAEHWEPVGVYRWHADDGQIPICRACACRKARVEIHRLRHRASGMVLAVGHECAEHLLPRRGRGGRPKVASGRQLDRGLDARNRWRLGDGWWVQLSGPAPDGSPQWIVVEPGGHDVETGRYRSLRRTHPGCAYDGQPHSSAIRGCAATRWGAVQIGDAVMAAERAHRAKMNTSDQTRPCVCGRMV